MKSTRQLRQSKSNKAASKNKKKNRKMKIEHKNSERTCADYGHAHLMLTAWALR